MMVATPTQLEHDSTCKVHMLAKHGRHYVFIQIQIRHFVVNPTPIIQHLGFSSVDLISQAKLTSSAKTMLHVLSKSTVTHGGIEFSAHGGFKVNAESHGGCGG